MSTKPRPTCRACWSGSRTARSILAKAGKPYARLVPLEQPARELGFVEGRVPESFFEPLPEDELAA